MKIITCIFATVALLSLCACKSPHLSQPRTSLDAMEIEEAVLAHMVTNAATDLDLVRFVTLSPERLEHLRKRCGSKFQIFPVKPSDTHHIGIETKASLIQVSGVKIKGQKAEASGAFSSSYIFDGREISSYVVCTYKLRKRHNY